MRKKVICYQLQIRKKNSAGNSTECSVIAPVMMTWTYSWNASEVFFFKLKLVTDNLLPHICRSYWMLTHVFVNASFPRDFFIVAAFIAPTRSSLFALIYVYIVYVIVLDKKENVVLLSIWTASLCSNCRTLRAVLNALHKWQDSALNFVMHLKYT